jgi:8-amino-7-oxononanoate synthase
LPPSVIAAALAALKIANAEPERAKKAIENANYFACNLQLTAYNSAIVPYIVGDSEQAVALSVKLKQNGFWVPAIRPPTVPEGTARLRFSFTAAHDKKQIDGVLQCLKF